MKIIYQKQGDEKEFELERFVASIQKYDPEVTAEQVSEALAQYSYDPMHVSVLVVVATNLISDEQKAKEYFDAHSGGEKLKFERLRRITGYLVGSLDRWNDAKQAEEQARVKHSVETKKQENLENNVNSCSGNY